MLELDFLDYIFYWINCIAGGDLDLYLARTLQQRNRQDL